ncbi:3-hydroxybutyryl-CoA dehydrogenase [Novosphingobium kaempferiae]|uniref:3-hydroxybutyryl-CoA dehydrogenase n=1 Tax=Novosphingobium kaempferiae TaxID=2896849 RepID=UPI001E478A32|nr:3-hydroxybutyryl-CoA dehydrogenase [Novosphingobium kaempferiae]
MTGSDAVIGVVGAGRMGRGIATAFALAGHQVRLLDLRQRSAQDFAHLAAAARLDVERDVAFLAEAGLLDAATMARVLDDLLVAPAAEASALLAGCDLVFEAVPETIPAKQEAFAAIGEAVRADALVASTTSTIDANTLAEMLPGPQRFMNAHWLNPAHLVPLIEVSPANVTDPAQVEALCAILRGIGKVPVVCRSSPGYIVPRIQALAMNEAARLVEEGVASAEDVDTAIRVGFGFRFAVLGLLEFIDWGGGDILFHASRYLSGTLDPQRFAAPEVVERNMAQGHNGVRDGKGFYDYQDMDLAAYRAGRLSEFVAMLRHRDMMPAIRGAVQ